MKNDKACINCVHYSAHYRSGIFSFWKENNGVCRKRDNPVKENDYCDFWSKARPDYSVTVKKVEIAIENVKAIIPYFKGKN